MNCKSIVALLLATIPTAVFSADETSGESSRATFGERIMTITDVVLDKHIEPPARQQMVLAALSALYRADNQPIPKGLSKRISSMTEPDQLADYLDSVGKEFDNLPDVEPLVTQAMLATLVGGGQLFEGALERVNDQLRNNRYVGIGIALTMNEQLGLPRIAKSIYEGPVWNAGGRAGDLILEIDGRPTGSKDLRQIVEELRGEEGSEVTIVVRQEKADESRELKMIRSRVFIPTVLGHREVSEGQWQYTVEDAMDIGFIRFASFGPSTLHELRKVAARLRSDEVRGIVLDLRTGGGLLHETIMVADSLLDGGTIGYVRSLDSHLKHEARPGDLFNDIPIAVLVGSETSAGNVFLTAALQDNGRAVVVGQPTAKETFVHSLVEIPEQPDKIRIATGLLYRSNGTLLQGPQKSTSPVVRQAATQKPLPMQNKAQAGFIVPDHPFPRYPMAQRQQANNRKLARLAQRDPTLALAIRVLSGTTAQAASSTSKKKDVSG